jgi:hypothetical protein
MPSPNQGACQSRKTAKKRVIGAQLGDFASQQLVTNPKLGLGTFASRGASNPKQSQAGVLRMIGKLLGAWLGEKAAGKNAGAKGAILGYGTVALAKRSVPTLAALALGGWAFRKWRDKRRSHASYPGEATPRVPASETASPS